jgi:hypothetical protein
MREVYIAIFVLAGLVVMTLSVYILGRVAGRGFFRSLRDGADGVLKEKPKGREEDAKK